MWATYLVRQAINRILRGDNLSLHDPQTSMAANRRSFLSSLGAPARRSLCHAAIAALALLWTSPILLAAEPVIQSPDIVQSEQNTADDAPLPPDPPDIKLPVPPAPNATDALPSKASANNVPANKLPAQLVSTSTVKSVSAACYQSRACDQIWLISTRQLGCGICLEGAPGLRFWRFENNAWAPADLKSFLADDDPHVPTDFYIHGNSNTAEDANDHGFVVYDQLTAGVPTNLPVRFVIWSWPTDPGRHPVQLIREHACRSDTDAWYLGWLLSQMDRRVPIGLAGYSFGARVATGAIHLMGGGPLLGSTLGLDPKAPPPPIRAVLAAAAEDEGWLRPNAPNNMTIPTLDRMLLLNNSCDSSLKHYPLMDRCTRASALGYVGLATNDPKIDQCDVCCTVGEEHNWANYFCSGCLVAKMRPYLYLANMPLEKPLAHSKAAKKIGPIAKRAPTASGATRLAAKP